MSQHSGVDRERWSRFDLDQQILMIGNEMNRSTRLLAAERVDSLRLGYERVLRLIDLTVECQVNRMLRRELLRWRDLVAELYVSESPDAGLHRSAFRALLQLRPTSAKQIPMLLGQRGEDAH